MKKREFSNNMEKNKFAIIKIRPAAEIQNDSFLIDSFVENWWKKRRSQTEDCNELGTALSHIPSIYVILNMSNPSSKAPSYVMLCTSTVRPRFHRSKIKRRYRDFSGALTCLRAIHATTTTSARWWNIYERSNEMRNEIGPSVEILMRMRYAPLRVQAVQPHLQLRIGR